MKKRHRASAVVVFEGQLLTVRLQDPHTKVVNYFIPGGKVESGESPEDAAKRETLEEAGIKIKIIPGSEIVETYPFVWNNELIECTTAFFAATCDNPSLPKDINDAPYNLSAQWLPLSDIDAKFEFDQNIFEPIKRLITKYFQ